MDYIIDFYSRNNNSNHNVMNTQFTYDTNRFCPKLYVFLKINGFIFYVSSLVTCKNYDFYICMLITMFLATINSIRYEYAHFKKYGTIFSSINDFEIWRNQQYPKSRIFFSSVEIIIKIIYFNLNFPPRCDLITLCNIGECILKIHIIILLLIYLIGGIFSIWFFYLIYCIDNSHRPIHIQDRNINFPHQILVINNQNEECCICMDIGPTEWSMLPCGHKFHQQCISIWFRTNRSCPICRLYFQ